MKKETEENGIDMEPVKELMEENAAGQELTQEQPENSGSEEAAAEAGTEENTVEAEAEESGAEAGVEKAEEKKEDKPGLRFHDDESAQPPMKIHVVETSRQIHSLKSKIGDAVIIFICVIIALICLLPMINLLARSLSGTDHLVKHEVYLLPKGLNFDAYTTVFADAKYIKAFARTITF